jgi:DNA-binding transcriptional MocR family regulator
MLARLRTTAVKNLALFTKFMETQGESMEFTPPAGGTTCFPRLRDGRNARPLCEALAKAGILVAPGDCFDAPAHMRIGFGALSGGYAEALRIFGEVLAAHRP